MSRAVLLGSLLIATQVLGASKLSVLPFKGPKATTPRAQIYFPLCEEAECVAVDKASAHGKPDFVKAKKNRIEGLLIGTVVKTGRKMTLDLKLLGVKGQTLYKKSYPLLPNGKLTPKQVSQAKDSILTSLSGGEGGGAAEEGGEEEVAEKPIKRGKEEAAEEESSGGAEEEEAPGAATREQKPSRREREEEESSASRRRRGSESEPEESSAEVSDSAPSTKRASKAPLFAIQAGPDFFGPSLQWTGVATPNLRRYSSPLVFAPHLHGEFYPLALVGDTATGLGVELDFMISVGSRTRKSNDETSVYSTTASRFDLAARYRLMPIVDSRFAVTPFFGYRSQSFKVGSSSTDGTPLDGLPSISYSALRLGAGVEVPIASVANLYVDAAFLPVLGTGEIGAAYFPGAKASGLEFNAGVGFLLGGGFEVRAMGRYTRYGLSFITEATAVYQATGATDQQLGIALALRFQY
ncbi:MAG: hypothetical protein ACT4TC_02470 [Myxococcaceae bacterium]